MATLLPRWFRSRAERAMTAMLELSVAARGLDDSRRALEREGEVWRVALGVDHAARGCALGLARKAWRATPLTDGAPPPLAVAPAFITDPVDVDRFVAALLRAAAAEPRLGHRAPASLAVRARFALGVLGLVATGELTDARVAPLALGSLDGDPAGVHIAIYDAALVAMEHPAERADWLRLLELARAAAGPSARAAARLVAKDRRFAREYLTCRRDGPVSMRVARIPSPPRRTRARAPEDLFAP